MLSMAACIGSLAPTSPVLLQNLRFKTLPSRPPLSGGKHAAPPNNLLAAGAVARPTGRLQLLLRIAAAIYLAHALYPGMWPSSEKILQN